MTKTKICKICGKEKNITEFYTHFNYKDNYMNICKDCYSLKNKKYRDENKDELNKKSKARYFEQKEKFLNNNVED